MSLDVTLKKMFYSGKQFGRFREGRQLLPDELRGVLPKTAIIHDEPAEEVEEVEEDYRGEDLERVAAEARSEVEDKAAAFQEQLEEEQAAAKPVKKVVKRASKS